ncbi:hypothetical protein GOP47_0019064 [Adiantum capillus-veneris]|uniref:Bacteriophage/plasmid primase P4 C-terminal domain-containing protein n=1 Tax=Adiantum capillus-veneris TaxID=13818 RepID=A0A9D4UEK0_ADICA|nr:hypothetical protein GOP47_0019064 [Adiantum capillus-veneris]
MGNRAMQKETLIFQARYLCNPPFEKEKELDLLRILENRVDEQAGKYGGETAELELKLDAHIGALLADRFKDTWAYLLPDEQWYEYKNQRWDSLPGWAYEMLNKIEEEMKGMGAAFTRPQRNKMSSQNLLKSLEEHLPRLLKRARTVDSGLPFLNGVLVPHESRPLLHPPSPLWVCTSYAGIELDMCTPMSPI